jgi:hypothetical protein
VKRALIRVRNNLAAVAYITDKGTIIFEV